jgi:ABC-type protease/lipase transport system fused ATPase/permease subunit
VDLHLRASQIAGGLIVSTRVVRLFLWSLILATGAYLAIHHAITAGPSSGIDYHMASACAG